MMPVLLVVGLWARCFPVLHFFIQKIEIKAYINCNVTRKLFKI